MSRECRGGVAALFLDFRLWVSLFGMGAFCNHNAGLLRGSGRGAARWIERPRAVRIECPRAFRIESSVLHENFNLRRYVPY